jgi:spermidine synthase
MKIPVILLTYFIFFLSGASALIHEIVWARYLGLVFGGSHLAVTCVLFVFMGGLAAGSYLIGRRIDSRRNLLRLFGFLEIGIGASALLFAGLMKVYPPVYILIAQAGPDSTAFITFIRVLFAVLALIIPTTLMGGTLPVLTAFTSRLMKETGIRLSFLYGFNTFGAVCGAAMTGFVMLRTFSMSITLATAVAINLFAGISAILLQWMIKNDQASEVLPEEESGLTGITVPSENHSLSRLVLWGIGVSGFCAMSYEVLWNRILSVAVGASAYGFTLLLMAFLSGIAAGSTSYGLYCRLSIKLRKGVPSPLTASARSFGVIQIVIGLSALYATTHFRYLPKYVVFLREFFNGLLPGADQFQVLQCANFTLAFSMMFVPAFFMGVAFPMAGAIHSRSSRLVGKAVGETVSFNTVGAILGAGVSGFILIYLFGIQRSLQIIILINTGYGLLLISAVQWGRRIFILVSLAVLAALMVPVFSPSSWELWNPKLYAIYQSNKPEAYGTDEEINEMMDNMDVRYYYEGAQSIVSSVQSADILFFITNGRVEASNTHQDMQCQYVLGHLPMLLHNNPRKVFVLGTGSGMTLGAVSVHPTVEKITLAEIEPGVLGVAKIFGIDNHYILSRPDPRLKIVFNDGRNHLLTTKDMYDVITADPVHPWFSGSGYLYSSEYFRLASQKLNPGGIICQWLPLYELTAENLKSVVSTIREHFAYSMIWVTHYDAEIIASNSPIIIDEKELTRRISAQAVTDDLRQIKMGSAEDFLSYFVMGSAGVNAYSKGGRINTDDNLYLEFSAPRSIGQEYLREANLSDILKYREKILPYLKDEIHEEGKKKQRARWEANHQAALLDDRAHVLDMTGKQMTYEYAEISAELEDRYPRYAPWRFVKEESGEEKGGTPRILQETNLQLIGEDEKPVTADISAIIVRKNSRWARVFFVDDSTKTVFGKLRVKGAGREAYIENFTKAVMEDVRMIYAEESSKAAESGRKSPSVFTVFPRIKTVVEARIDLE